MSKKARVSETELKKNPLPGTGEFFDIVLLEKFLNGKTIQDLSNEMYIGRGQVDMRIKITLKAITAFLDERELPEVFFKLPLVYKNYWINSIHEYHLLRTIRNPASQFSIFLLYFTGRTLSEKLRMIQELENHLGEDGK